MISKNYKLRQIFDWNNWQAELAQIAVGAGRETLKVYDSSDMGEAAKADDSPVTKADLAAHHYIQTSIDALGFEVPVVSEESQDSLIHRIAGEPYWLVDPLDGTKDFINKNGEFTINIALVDGTQSLWGVVYVPVTGELYIGGKDFAAQKLIVKDQAICLNKAPSEVLEDAAGITVSKAENPVRIMASKSHMNDETKAYIDQIESVSLVQAGSSLKFCRIAEGLADIYPRMGPTCEWDTAAAQAIVEGAGGQVLQLNGEPLVYSKTDQLNPYFVVYGDADLVAQYH